MVVCTHGHSVSCGIIIFWLSSNGSFSFTVFVVAGQCIALFPLSLVGNILIGFWDVTFLPTRACFSTTFLNNCGRGESIGTTTCLKTVVGVGKCMIPVEYFHSNKASSYVS